MLVNGASSHLVSHIYHAMTCVPGGQCKASAKWALYMVCVVPTNMSTPPCSQAI